MDTPFKRLAFVGLVLSLAWLAVLSFFPTPYESIESGTWVDASPAGAAATRTVDRVDLFCVSKLPFGSKVTINDIELLGAMVDENPYSLTLLSLVDSRRTTELPFNEKVDFAGAQLARALEMFDGRVKVCTRDQCLQSLSKAQFEDVLKVCSNKLGQNFVGSSHTEWRFVSNLQRNGDLAAIAIGLVAFFALTSIFYKPTLGRLLKWIRTGN